MRLFKYLLFCFLLIASGDLMARHIVGGEVTYRCLGVNTMNNTVRFEITVQIYRDSYGGGAPFDDPARFGLYQGSGNNWTYVTTFQQAPISKTEINTDTGNPCLTVPANIGVEEGVYRFEITVPISDTDSYQIVYQRCCRNNTIFNIIDPDVTGATYSVEISPQAQIECDNSATFDDFPPVIICAEARLSFDHGATDPDPGDQVTYEFCNPIAGGGIRGINGSGQDECDGITPSPVNCPPPYELVAYKVAQGFTINDPLGAGVLTLDPNTGFLTGVPQTVGQFVVGICAVTRRNGVVISRISRDFQFNVTPCEIEVQANIASDEIINGSEFVINSCGENTVFFDNESIDESKITSYEWEFDINGDTLRLDTRDVTVTFPDTGLYSAVMYLNRDEEFADCKDTAVISVNIFPSIEADFEFDYDTCVAGEVEFFDLSTTGAGNVTEWLWTFEEDQTEIIMNPEYRYQDPGLKQVNLVVTDKNECSDEITKEFNWYPVPPLLIVQPDQFIGCVPAAITFNNLSSPINEEYDIIWDFGDGNTVNELSPTHVYEETGVYRVTLNVTSPLGCETDASFGDWITVLESPVAGFSYSPENPSNFNKTITFTDESTGGQSWIYDFNGIAKLERNPTYTFPDTGVVEVYQIVTHPTGCTDTAYALIDIEPLVTLHLPNAFTPNDDGLNDDFRGKGFFDGFRSYRMQIWNRWGEMIFESTDPEIGWDGKKQSSGALAQPGVYVYTVEYDPPRGEPKLEKGHVTLIR